MGGKAGFGDMQSHAEVLLSLQSPVKGAKIEDNKLLEELSAALNESRTDDHARLGRPILSRQDLIAELEERYLTPNTKVEKSLLGTSQM